MNMCSDSVDPMPSLTSRPNRRLKRSYGVAGSDSPGGTNPKDALPEQLRADDHVVLQMDAALWGAGAARRIQPERRRVAMGRVGVEVRRALRKERIDGRDDVTQVAAAIRRNRVDGR